MREVIRATSIPQLPAINAVIHDCFFDADEILMDYEEQELHIPFDCPIETERRVLRRVLFFEQSEAPVAQASLVLGRVKESKIEDPNQIGDYDFNKVVYDPSAGEVSILTGVPIDIRAAVEDLDLEVRISDVIVGRDRGWTLFGTRLTSRPRRQAQ